MIQLYVFDAYGTLFDVHAAAARERERLGPVYERLSQTWRTKHLEYTWIHSQTGRAASFWTLAERSLDYAIAVVGGVPSGVREALLATYRHMPPFPEVPATLARLNGNGSTCAILTNGDQAMIDTVVAASGLSPAFKALLSVEDAGIFKPARRVYQLVLDRFAGTPGDVTFVSSNRWDIAGAHVFGFQTVWLNRSGLPDEYPDMPAGRILADLSQLG